MGYISDYEDERKAIRALEAKRRGRWWMFVGGAIFGYCSFFPVVPNDFITVFGLVMTAVMSVLVHQMYVASAGM